MGKAKAYEDKDTNQRGNRGTEQISDLGDRQATGKESSKKMNKSIMNKSISQQVKPITLQGSATLVVEFFSKSKFHCTS